MGIKDGLMGLSLVGFIGLAVYGTLSPIVDNSGRGIYRRIVSPESTETQGRIRFIENPFILRESAEGSINLYSSGQMLSDRDGDRKTVEIGVLEDFTLGKAVYQGTFDREKHFDSHRTLFDELDKTYVRELGRVQELIDSENRN